MADPYGFFLDFAVAAGIGGLIGVEREHRPDNQSVIAGIRTFPLISSAGFLVAFLARETLSPLVLAAGVLGVFGLALMIIQIRQALGQTGVTTPAAMVVTFLLGALIAYGYTIEAVAVGLVATFLLVTKERLHRFARILDDAEILSALQFLTLLFVLLPITAGMPGEVLDQAWLGRGALVDPYVVLLVVIFVSAISFASLVAMRAVGPRRGLEVSGLLGGLVNSEATTAGLAERAKHEPALERAAVVAAALATTTMLARNLAIVAFADRSLALARGLWVYFLPIALAGAGVWLWNRTRDRSAAPVPAVRVRNPFAVLPALRFALVFAGVSVFATLARGWFGDAGVYAAALGGFVSAGAVLGGVAGAFAAGAIPFGAAAKTAVLATAASVVAKPLIMRVVNPAMLRRAAVPFGAMAAGALVAVIGAFVVAPLV